MLTYIRYLLPLFIIHWLPNHCTPRFDNEAYQLTVKPTLLYPQSGYLDRGTTSRSTTSWSVMLDGTVANGEAAIPSTTLYATETESETLSATED